jgi:hypothetical protein
MIGSLVHSEQERMWKEVFVVKFEITVLAFAWKGLTKTTKTLSIVGLWPEI